MRYMADGRDLIVLAGKDYGMGSSRDWAAKGTALLGVKAVIAESYERIHRSNLIGMGVLPLQYQAGENPDVLGLDGTETFDIRLGDGLTPGQSLDVVATNNDGATRTFTVVCRLDTQVEVAYHKNGGILHYVLREFLRGSTVTA
jgi:aconitate hydratase